MATPPAPASAPAATTSDPPVKVRLLLFAVYRDLAGGRSAVEVEVPPGSDVAAALDAARASFPELQALPERPVVAVNQEYAPLTTALEGGDEVALLPPVAGG
jgi:molybdopterin synthase sulfur carrier subunit